MRMGNRHPNSPMMRMKRHEYEDELPEEVIREILLRLSVRVLLRLRSVCRSWNSLICSHEFAMIHVQHSTLTQRPPLLCWEEGSGRKDDIMHCSSQSLILYRQQTTFVSYPAPGKFIRGSCNGLLCLSQGFPYKTLTLFNPSIRSVSPSVPFGCSHECGNFVYGGFGYDILHDQYKFVMGCGASSLITDSKVRSGAVVFTFGANPCWKTVDHPVFPYHVADNGYGIFVSGTLNWLVYDSTSTRNYKTEWFVLTFDLKTESFGRMCLPIVSRCSDYTQVPQLSLHNNCLCYSVYTTCTLFCTFWIMKEHGVKESWIKWLAIPFTTLISPYVSVAPLYVSEDHNLLALDKSNDSLFVYNLRQNTLLYLYGYFPYRMSFFLCHESLVSPSHYCGLKTID